MTTYEFALTTMGLKEFILYVPRDGLVAANKEGICSALGYISIMLIAMSFGRIVYNDLFLEDKVEKNKDAESNRKHREFKVFCKFFSYYCMV
jgi:hypothetical protein